MTVNATKTRLHPSTETDDKPKFFGLSLTQTLVGALAAITSALAASFLGVAGTIIGAALGSIVVTISTALFSHTLTTAKDSIRSTSLVGKQESPSQVVVREAAPAPRPVAGPDHSDRPVRVIVTGRARRKPRRRLWVAMVTMFLLAVGAITGTELILGHPVSSAKKSGTSVSQFVAPPATTEPKPSASQDPTPQPSATHTATDPATEPAPPAESASPEPGPTPPAAPNTSAPAPQPSQHIPAAPIAPPATAPSAAGPQAAPTHTAPSQASGAQ